MTGASDVGDPIGIKNQWNTAEFHLVGICCGHTAVLNPNSTLVVQTDVNVAGGAAAQPSQVPGGYTLENNNLSVIAPSCVVQFGPSGLGTVAVNRLLFTESNALIPPTSMCDCPSGASWTAT
jgi:hypothetical protein